MNDRADRLYDALRQLVGWIEEGCHDDGRQYVLTEARAALKDLRTISGLSQGAASDEGGIQNVSASHGWQTHNPPRIVSAGSYDPANPTNSNG